MNTVKQKGSLAVNLVLCNQLKPMYKSHPRLPPDFGNNKLTSVSNSCSTFLPLPMQCRVLNIARTGRGWGATFCWLWIKPKALAGTATKFDALRLLTRFMKLRMPQGEVPSQVVMNCWCDVWFVLIVVCYWSTAHMAVALTCFDVSLPFVSSIHEEGTTLMIEPTAWTAPMIRTLFLSHPKTSWHVSCIGGHVFQIKFAVVFNSVKRAKMYQRRL